MATSTIDHNKFYLLDKWPGEPWEVGDVPTGGFTGSSHHNVTSPAYPVGMKLNVMCTHTSYTRGGATFIYLRNTGFDSTDLPLGAKHLVTCDDTNQWYNVTSDSGSDLLSKGQPAAVALSAMSTTTGAYGWFWCGGVCPIEYVAGLDGNYITDTSVVAGPLVLAEIDATHATYGFLGLSACVTNTGTLPIAFALAADE